MDLKQQRCQHKPESQTEILTLHHEQRLMPSRVAALTFKVLARDIILQ